MGTLTPNFPPPSAPCKPPSMKQQAPKFSLKISYVPDHLRLVRLGVPAVVQWNWQCLGSTRIQVPSPARHSGLRILHCLSCGLGHNCGSDLIPDPGTLYALGWPKRKKKKRLVRVNSLQGSSWAASEPGYIGPTCCPGEGEGCWGKAQEWPQP